MSAAPKLRAVPGGRIVDTQSGEVEYEPEDHALLQLEHRKALRTIQRLKRELSKMHELDPEAETVTAIMQYWREKTGHDKAKIPLDGRRAAAVRRMLKVFEVEQLRAAIDGCAAMPFMGSYGVRYCCDGDGRKRKDDLAYILRDEAQVEAFIKLADGDEAHKAYRSYVHGLCKSSPQVLLALAILGDKPPHGEVLRKAALWAHKQV